MLRRFVTIVWGNQMFFCLFFVFFFWLFSPAISAFFGSSLENSFDFEEFLFLSPIFPRDQQQNDFFLKCTVEIFPGGA